MDKLTPEERRQKEMALEQLLAEFGVTRETLDDAYDDLLKECYAMAAGDGSNSKRGKVNT